MAEREAALEVTLITGLQEHEKTAVARALSGTAPSLAAQSPFSAAQSPFPAAQSPFAMYGAHPAEFATDLADHLEQLASARKSCGHVVIQLEADADIIDIGFTLEQRFEDLADDAARAGLRDIVAVTSVRDIRRWLFSESDSNRTDDDTTDFVTAERLALQLEFATTIVITDVPPRARPGVALTCEAASHARHDEVRLLLFKLNPRARVVSLARVADLRHLPSWSRRSLARRLGHTMGWILELAGRVGPPTLLDPINTTIFRDPRLFHPERLARAIASDLLPANSGLILRSRGVVRLASRPDRVGSWSTAGGVLTLEPTSMLSWDCESPLGQEIVFFGRNVRREALAECLERCLLTTDELLAGPHEWRRYRDEFPAWAEHHSH